MVKPRDATAIREQGPGWDGEWAGRPRFPLFSPPGVYHVCAGAGELAVALACAVARSVIGVRCRGTVQPFAPLFFWVAAFWTHYPTVGSRNTPDDRGIRELTVNDSRSSLSCRPRRHATLSGALSCIYFLCIIRGN